MNGTASGITVIGDMDFRWVYGFTLPDGFRVKISDAAIRSDELAIEARNQSVYDSIQRPWQLRTLDLIITTKQEADMIAQEMIDHATIQ